MGRVEDIPSTGFEQSMNEVEMRADIIGVEVLEKLVAEDDVGDACGQVEVVTVIDDEFKVGESRLARGALVGDVHSNDAVRQAGGGITQTTVAWGELHEGFVLAEERAQQAELAVHLAAAFLWRFPAGEAGVVGNALEKLIVEFFEEGRTLLPGACPKAGGKFLFDLVVVAETFGGAGHG
jgi:hypothetical protein